MALVWKRERKIIGRLVVKGRIILKCFYEVKWGQGLDRWRALVTPVMNFRFQKMWGIY